MSFHTCNGRLCEDGPDCEIRKADERAARDPANSIYGERIFWDEVRRTIATAQKTAEPATEQ